jgi:hypothetical protein
MVPFYVKVENEVGLFELNDGRFQPTQKGALSRFMVGFKYILVENDIAQYLQSLDIERVTFKPAIIWERNTNKEHSNYQQMCVNHHFDLTMASDLNIEGKQFLLMDNRYLFASPELAAILSTHELGASLSEGFNV